MSQSISLCTVVDEYSLDLSCGITEDLQAGQVLVGGSMTELHKPCGQSKLLGNAVNGPGVGTELEGIDEPVDEPNDGGRVAHSEGQGCRGRSGSSVLEQYT